MSREVLGPAHNFAVRPTVAGGGVALLSELALKAPLANPAFTGTATFEILNAQQFRCAIDPTTRFYESGAGQILVDVSGVNIGAWNSAGYNGLLAGGCVAVTQAPGTNTTQLATTAFATAGLALKADLNAPALTGNATISTGAANSNTTRLANEAFVQQEIADVIASSPAALDTLLELANALGSDPNFASTMTSTLALKAPISNAVFTGTHAVSGGVISLTHGTANRVEFGIAGLQAPAVGSVGAKIYLYGTGPSMDPANHWVIGMAGASMWFNVGSGTYDWYVNGVAVAQIGAVPAAGDNTVKLSPTSWVRALAAELLAFWQTMMDCTASHTAARVLGTYWLGHGQAAGITGTGTLYSPTIFRIDTADFPTVSGIAPKFRIKGILNVNDVAPTGNYTFGLYPVTRPATSGGAGLAIYTMGTVIAGSTVAVNAPAADSQNTFQSADFALPAAGFYVIGFVSTANVAASSHLHISALLQRRNA